MKAMLLALFLLTACQDTGDDECDADTGEGCDDERDVPRDGSFLPYEAKEQALYALPNFVWTSPTLPTSSTWPATTGGAVVWRHIGAGDYVCEPASVVLSRQLSSQYRCPAPSQTATAVRCTYGVGVSATIACPTHVSVTKPIAYSADRVSLKYDFGAKYEAARPVLRPSRIELSALSGGGYRVICRYPSALQRIQVTSR